MCCGNPLRKDCFAMHTSMVARPKPAAARSLPDAGGCQKPNLFSSTVRQTKTSPRPHRLCIRPECVRTLARARANTTLTDLEPMGFEVVQQARGLPVIHRLFMNSAGYSLGYTQRAAQGNPS